MKMQPASNHSNKARRRDSMLLKILPPYKSDIGISQRPSSVSIEIIPASPEQAPVLANLLELYAHDFSEFIDLKLGADGRFGYEHLSLYWTEPDRYPFLLTVNDYLAGFVFVHRGSQISVDESIWDMAEFFIVRGYRRLGIGRQVAHEIWKKFPGRWEVRVMDRNQKAKDFWECAIGEFIGTAINPIPFDKDGEGWHVFSFESKRAA
jgi:predicted acetyltransferase